MAHTKIPNPISAICLISSVLLLFSETGCVGTVYSDRGGPLFGIVLALLILFGSIVLAFGIRSTFQHKESETEVKDGKEVANVFISYSSSDKIIADRIAEMLRVAGIKVLIDSHNLESGENIEDFIRRSIQASTRTLLIVSNNSFSSPWVGFEIVYAIHFSKAARKRILIPCYLDRDFLDDGFLMAKRLELNKKLEELEKSRKYMIGNGFGTTNLDERITRLILLIKNLDKIIAHLTRVHSVDIRGELLEKNVQKIISEILYGAYRKAILIWFGIVAIVLVTLIVYIMNH